MFLNQSHHTIAGNELHDLNMFNYLYIPFKQNDNQKNEVLDTTVLQNDSTSYLHTVSNCIIYIPTRGFNLYKFNKLRQFSNILHLVYVYAFLIMDMKKKPK